MQKNPSAGEERTAPPPVVEAKGWILLAAELPVSDVEARMAVLRTFETLGAVALREGGVYLLPESEASREAFSRLADRIRRAGATAHVFAARTLDTAETVELVALFDRNPRYAAIIKTVESLRAGFGIADPSAIAAVLAKQRRDLQQVIAVDFFASRLRNEAERVVGRCERLIRKVGASSE
jgi:hypothetical protein